VRSRLPPILLRRWTQGSRHLAVGVSVSHQAGSILKGNGSPPKGLRIWPPKMPHLARKPLTLTRRRPLPVKL